MSSSPTFGKTFKPLEDHLHDPYGFYSLAREQEPIFYAPDLYAAGVGAWVVSRYKDIVDIVHNPDDYSSANALTQMATLHPRTIDELKRGPFPPGPMTVRLDGEPHKRMREPLAKALTAKRIKALEPYIRSCADRLIDKLEGRDRFDFMREFAYPISMDVSLCLYGLPDANIDVLRDGGYALLKLFFARIDEGAQVEVAKKVVAFRKAMVEHIRNKNFAASQDLMTEVIKANLPSGSTELTEQLIIDIQENLVGVFLASNIPISNSLGLGLRNLLGRPELWRLLCDHAELIPSAIEEMWRFETPSPGLFRTATRNVILNARTYPTGTHFFLLYGSANRDAQQFDDAERFDIRREPGRHLTFGSGVHTCVGAPLVRMALKTIWELLTCRLPNISLDPDRAISVRPSLFERGPAELWVRAEPSSAGPMSVDSKSDRSDPARGPASHSEPA